jgi:hypothetical protein
MGCHGHLMPQAWAVVDSMQQFVQLAEQASALSGVLDAGDWYLVGSRVTGLCDDLSDWDTIVLVAKEPVGPTPSRAMLDEVFAVDRPTLTVRRHWAWIEAGEPPVGSTSR